MSAEGRGVYRKGVMGIEARMEFYRRWVVVVVVLERVCV